MKFQAKYRQYIQPSRALIVAVGNAAEIVEPLRVYGPVRVVDAQGTEVRRVAARPAEASASSSSGAASSSSTAR